MLSLLKDFSFWKILPGERPVPLPPLSQLFFSVGVLFIYFSSFLILWCQFKSLYKCPRIQYKVGFFFFKRNVFSSASWLEDLHYIFFSFKYLSTSLLFFLFFSKKYQCMVFLISLYRNSLVWIEPTGIQIHLTKQTRTGDGMSAEMFASSAHHNAGKTLTVCLLEVKKK